MILSAIKLGNNGTTEKDKMRTTLKQIFEEFFSIQNYKEVYKIS